MKGEGREDIRLRPAYTSKNHISSTSCLRVSFWRMGALETCNYRLLSLQLVFFFCFFFCLKPACFADSCVYLLLYSQWRPSSCSGSVLPPLPLSSLHRPHRVPSFALCPNSRGARTFVDCARLNPDCFSILEELYLGRPVTALDFLK